MAAIDKIYGTNDQWQELFRWLANSNRPQYIKYLTNPFDYEPGIRTISSFPTVADKWLYKNCPLKWVKESIEFQYAGAPQARSPLERRVMRHDTNKI
jgi:hypothetical protein